MSSSPTIGRVLFRWRGWMPVPIIVALLFVVVGSAGSVGPGGETVDGLLKMFGVGLAAAGEALRFVTLGLVPEGTSGQGYVLEASSLNTRGPYAYVRNPLYLGNFGICVGLLLVANNAWAYAIGFAFFFAQYFFIIRAEESFLRQTYGERYDEYASKVPRSLPRLTPAYPGRLGERFDWARAIKKEHNPFAAWSSAMLLLVGWQLYGRGSLTKPIFALLVALQAGVLATFALVKAFKRGWI